MTIGGISTMGRAEQYPGLPEHTHYNHKTKLQSGSKRIESG
jgi:hypothetical protein